MGKVGRDAGELMLKDSGEAWRYWRQRVDGLEALGYDDRHLWKYGMLCAFVTFYREFRRRGHIADAEMARQQARIQAVDLNLLPANRLHAAALAADGEDEDLARLFPEAEDAGHVMVEG